MSLASKSALLRIIGTASRAQPHERNAALAAFFCNFFLLASYYVLRPLRDTMATVFGAAQLQDLFTGTFILTLLLVHLFAWCAGRIKLSRFLPGVFWLLIASLLIFYRLFQLAPGNRWLAGEFYSLFSVI